MYDIRLRKFTPEGVRGAVLRTRSITFTSTRNGTPLLDFSMANAYAGSLEAPFLVGVEVSRDGSAWVTPRNNLFIVLEDDADSSTTEMVSFTSAGFVGWSLSAAIHWWAPGATANPWKRKYEGAPGKILRTLIAEVQARGTMPNVGIDFTNTADSVGQAWTADDKIDMQLELWKPLAVFVQNWSEQGHFDWWSEGTTFRVARSGYGVDRTSSIVLGGRGFTSSPVRSDFRNVITRMVLIPDGTTATHVENLTSDLRFGHIEASMTQSGIDTHAKAVKEAQPIMNDRRAKGTELEYNWTPAGKMVAPFLDFNVGDEVTARRRSGKSAQRVISAQVSKTITGEVTVRVVVGTELIGLTARIAKKASAASQGQIISGSGVALPPSAGVASGVPLAPTGLVLTSNVGRWRKDGSGVADIRVEWQAVVSATDESAINVRQYEIATRVPSALSVTAGRTDTTGWTRELPSGELTLIKVRAIGANGQPGEWSDEISVTPAMPASIVPKVPTNLVASQTAFYSPGGAPKSRVVLSWDAVTQSTDDTPVDVVRYDVWERTGPGVSVFLSSAKTASLTFEIPSDGDRWYRVQAVSDLGFAGDLSTELKVSPGVPPVDTSPPATPVLVPGIASVEAQWNGLMQSGSAPGAHIANVLAQWSATGSAPWKSVGGPLSRAGSVTVPGSKGVPVHVRFVTMDSLGRTGGVSAVVSAAPTGVGVPDIDAAIQDAIDQATADANNALLTASTADGRVTVSPDAPVAGDGDGKALGSVWFRRSAGGMFIGVWEWTALGWVSRQLDNATIASLDAAKIDTGFLNAARIAANTINARMINIGDFTNLASGSDFEDAEKIPWTLPAAFEVTSDYAYSGTKSLRVNGALSGTASLISGGIPVSADDEFYVEFWMRRDAAWNGTIGNSKMRFGFNGGGLFGLAFAASDAPVGVWTKRSGVLKVPNNGTTSMNVTIVASDATAGYAWLDDIVIRRRAAGNLLVDGAVGAREINTIELWADSAWIEKARIGVLEAESIRAPEFAQNLNLEANGSITMIVGQLDQTASDMAAVADAAANAQAAATGATNAANSASAVAGGAVSQALEALNAATALQGDLTGLQAIYQYTSTEAIITTPSGEKGLHLSPDGIEMRENGQAITRWEGQRMIVQQIVVDGMSVGNHRVESNGTNRTTWRPL